MEALSAGHAYAMEIAIDLYYAHSANGLGHWHLLVEHLQSVADQAAAFAEPFGAADLARLAGLWHDTGKFSRGFQEYLQRCALDQAAKGTGPDHKAAGALLAAGLAPPLALLIQGHHGGLHARKELPGWLEQRQAEPAEAARIAEALATARRLIPGLEPSTRPPQPAGLTTPHAMELFVRMLFSTLVDADCLDTERHFTPDQTANRGTGVSLKALWERLERSQRAFVSAPETTVGTVRREVYEACLSAASGPPGLYRLTVPTGGGKTRSGMAFALQHALHHGLSRVIVAVPFISITEQTADVYQEIFESADEGEDRPVVLEHHSAIPDEQDDSHGDPHMQQVWRRLASQNWDAPIVVTTTVQLFQSLFAARTSPCRKLHRLAKSVIILDEAQALPARLLEPLLDVLQELCSRYGATVVLSTATQPAFDTIPVFANVPMREIVPNPARHFAALRRVRYEWQLDPPMSWEDVADLVRSERAALVIVNTKKDAQALLAAVGGDSDQDLALEERTVLHLSTLLCGAHRRDVLKAVKVRLAAGLPCTLISTQVVEAGVDIDFPLVLRALGPLDSIIQAAGRCNREGKLAHGRVIVFAPADGGMPQGAYRTAVGVTRSLLGGGPIDPDDPAEARRYFQGLYAALHDLDQQGIQPLREHLDYPAVAERFRMIEEDTESIAVLYGTPKQRKRRTAILGELRRGSPKAAALLRRLQPSLVALPRRDVQRFARQGSVVAVCDGVWEWIDGGAYHPVLGLLPLDLNPRTLVV